MNKFIIGLLATAMTTTGQPEKNDPKVIEGLLRHERQEEMIHYEYKKIQLDFIEVLCHHEEFTRVYIVRSNGHIESLTDYYFDGEVVEYGDESE